MSSRRNKPFWLYGLSLAIGLASLYIIIRTVYGNLDTLRQIKDHFQLWPILITFPIYFCAEVLAGIVWGKIMNDIGTDIRMGEHIKIHMATAAARRLPGSIWHYVGRIAWYERLGVPKRLTTYSGVLETLVNIWSGLIVTFTMVFSLPGNIRHQAPLFLFGVAICAILMHPRILSFILKKLNHEQNIQTLKINKVAVWLLIDLFIWLLAGTMLFLLVKAIYPVQLQLWTLCLGAISLASVLGSIILLLPSGFGLSEASTTVVLATQIPGAAALAGAVLMRIMQTFFDFLLAGMVLLLFGIPKRPAISSDKNNQRVMEDTY